jgi:hypothetical protein
MNYFHITFRFFELHKVDIISWILSWFSCTIENMNKWWLIKICKIINYCLGPSSSKFEGWMKVWSNVLYQPIWHPNYDNSYWQHMQTLKIEMPKFLMP